MQLRTERTDKTKTQNLQNHLQRFQDHPNLQDSQNIDNSCADQEPETENEILMQTNDEIFCGYTQVVMVTEAESFSKNQFSEVEKSSLETTENTKGFQDIQDHQDKDNSSQDIHDPCRGKYFY